MVVGVMGERGTMSHGHEAIGQRQQWVWIIVFLAALLFASVVPGHTWRGRGHGFHGGHRFGGPRIGIGIGPFWGTYWEWGPYWPSYAYLNAYPYAYPYAYPPVVRQPAQKLSIQPPSLPPSWYYCDNPKGYYLYVQRCPGGWRPVSPTPP